MVFQQAMRVKEIIAKSKEQRDKRDVQRQSICYHLPIERRRLPSIDRHSLLSEKVFVTTAAVSGKLEF